MDPIPEEEKELQKRPEALNLLNIYAEISKITVGKVLEEMSGKDFSYVKKKLSDALIAEICPIGKKIGKLIDDKGHLEKILKEGREKAQLKAEQNMKKVREIVGLI